MRGCKKEAGKNNLYLVLNDYMFIKYKNRGEVNLKIDLNNTTDYSDSVQNYILFLL